MELSFCNVGLAPFQGKRYIGAFFGNGPPIYDLRIFESDDGINFQPRTCKINLPSIGPTEYRDTSITFWNDKWWVVHTGGNAVSQFGLISSSDLCTWSTDIYVDTSSISGIAHTWAPEWFLEPSDPSINGVHVLVSCSITDQSSFRIYEMHPTSEDMSTWSAPVALNIPALQFGFLDDIIDPFLLKVGSTYYLWVKNDNQGFIGYWSSSSLLGPYTQVEGYTNWAGFGSHEGPALIQGSDGNWILYMAVITGGTPQGILYSQSSDNWATWTTPTMVPGFDALSHGTVFKRY